jgi:hypothetical protein
MTKGKSRRIGKKEEDKIKKFKEDEIELEETLSKEK